MRCNIYEVMEYGSIVFSNEEYGVLITVNGAYFNWWNRVYDWASGFGRTNDGAMVWTCADVLYCGFGGETSSAGLYAKDDSTQLITIQDRAKEWFERVINEHIEEDEDEDIIDVVEDFE